MENTYQPLGVGVGTLIDNRYELLRKLGSGAMSAVYLACDRALNNDTLALKVFSPGINNQPNLVERIQNEVLITRKLSHPHIVRTYDFGQTKDGLYYMTMEYIEGTALDRFAKGQGLQRPRFEEFVRILRDVCRGMAYAHDHGVVHRDLKPANIMITPEGEGKIADFGLARALHVSQELTQVGECVGTPFYMSPEQIQDLPFDGRSDIYAVGVMGYELVNGYVPFEEQNWYQLAKLIISAPLPPFDARCRAPEWYKEFVMTAAAKRPEQRYLSAHVVAELLQSKLTTGDAEEVWSTESKLPKVLSNLGQSVANMKHSAPRMAASQVLIATLAIGMLAVMAVAVSSTSPSDVKERSETLNNFADSITKMTQFVTYMVHNKDKIDKLSKEMREQDVNPPKDPAKKTVPAADRFIQPEPLEPSQ